MTTEKEQLEAEIAKRDAQIADLERFKCAYNEWHEKTEWVQSEVSTGIIGASALGLHRADVMTRLVAELRLELAALKAERLSAGGAYSSDPLACSGCAAGCFRCRSSAGEYGDAYQGAREDLAIWKRRALEAETKVREQDQIIDHLTLEAQGETRFGEPVVSAGVVDERAALENLAKDYERRAEGPCPGWAWAADVARDIRARLNQPTAGDGVLCALMSALEGVVHDQRVPNEVSQECAAVLIEARRLNHCRAQAVADGLFFKDSQELAEALGAVKCLHDMSVELIAERVFVQRGEC